MPRTLQHARGPAAAEHLMRVEPPVRVALIASSFRPFVGGVETHVEHVAKELLHKGYVVEVWTVDRTGRASVLTDGKLTVRSLPAPLPARSVRAIARFVWRLPHALLSWRKANREFSPSILHVHCFGPNGVYATEIAATHRMPLIVTSHGETMGDDDSAFAGSALLRWSLRRAIGRAAAVTAPSDYVLADLRRRFGLVRGEIVPNGVEMSPIPSVSAAPRRDLVGVGRLGAMKGFDLLIEAFSRAQLPAEVKLVIGGDGPERERLERLANDLLPAGRVSFRGWMNPAEVAEVMGSALAVIVPSRSEAFGIVALEAWRAGTPLVMTNRGGAAEFMIDGEDALLVDPTDTEAFAATLHRALDPGRREAMSCRGRERVQEFSWRRVAADYAAIYDEVAQRH